MNIQYQVECEYVLHGLAYEKIETKKCRSSKQFTRNFDKFEMEAGFSYSAGGSFGGMGAEASAAVNFAYATTRENEKLYESDACDENLHEIRNHDGHQQLWRECTTKLSLNYVPFTVVEKRRVDDFSPAQIDRVPDYWKRKQMARDYINNNLRPPYVDKIREGITLTYSNTMTLSSKCTCNGGRAKTGHACDIRGGKGEVCDYCYSGYYKYGNSCKKLDSYNLIYNT